MNTTEKKFRIFAKKNKLRIIGEFENVHGELFVVYRLPPDLLRNIIFVTGDELDWEMGWKWDESTDQLMQTFLLGQDELLKLSKLVKDNK